MFNKKDLVKQIKYESVNSLISNAQASDWAVGAWAPQPTKGTGSPSSPTAKTGPSKAAPSSQPAVLKMQQTLKSLHEKLNFKINPNIKKYFTDNFFNKSLDNLLTLKADSQWGKLTDASLNLIKEFLNSIAIANKSLNLEVEGLNEEISGKMNELLSGYKIAPRGRVLLQQNELEKRAEELNEILEKIPSFYQSVLNSLSKKYGSTILNDEKLDDLSEKEIPLSKDELTLLNNNIKFNNIDLPLSLLKTKQSFNELIGKYFPDISNDPSKIKAKFNEIKQFINTLP